MVPLIILFCLFTVTLAGKHDIYSGFTVYGVPLRDRSDQITLDGVKTDINIDSWDHGVPGGRDAYVMVSPEKRNAFVDGLEKHGLKHYVHFANILGALKMFHDELPQWGTRSNIMRVSSFQTFYPAYAQERMWRRSRSLNASVNKNNGNNNSGINNNGDNNSGNDNTGNNNSGNNNVGDYNSGNHNTGNNNIGDYNTGDNNSGNDNRGNNNSGDNNTGDYNSGNHNIGNNNIGDYNTGDYNSGNHNIGNNNSGDYNIGDNKIDNNSIGK